MFLRCQYLENRKFTDKEIGEYEGAVSGVLGAARSPPPKNVEQDIYEYVDCKNKDTFFTTNLL